MIRRTPISLLLLVPILGVCIFSSALRAGELSQADFERLYKELQPAVDEPWRTIPWKIRLLDAQETAAREKKPIFIWAMDGHPLGCT